MTKVDPNVVLTWSLELFVKLNFTLEGIGAWCNKETCLEKHD